MPRDIFVALIDSGCRFDTHEKIAVNIKDGKTQIVNQDNVKYRHGDVIGEIIASNENIKIYDIQVFDKDLSTTPLHIIRALEYLKNKNVHVINMSLGLKTNYKEIEELCNYFTSKGITIISSFPRSGVEFVYPASYNEVISVTSDGKCENNQVSCVDYNKLLFGANPFSGIEGVGGSSVAVAKFTRFFCEYLQKGYKKQEILEKIKKVA